MGAEVELGFTDLLANGQAVGRTGGMVVFCFGPLPHERARVRITSVKPKYAVGEMLQLTLGSRFRAQPFCPVFGSCGGCQVQHLSYPAQLGWKRDVVKNALARIGGFADAAVRDPIGMINPRSYRNKMSLVVDRSGGLPRLGFYQQRSHDLVPIAGCPIVMPQLNMHIMRLNEALLQPSLAGAFADTRHIVARTAKATEQTVVTFTTEHPSGQLAAAAPALMRHLPGVVGITNSYDLSSVNAILGRKHTLLQGAAQIEEQIAGVRYRVSAGSFFQVNVEIVGRIFEFMRPGLDVPRKIVDLYCGAGTFSLYFSKLGSEVLGVEENPQAIAEAEENAQLNELQGSVRFISARVEDAVRRGQVRERLREAQIVFLDPPRKGSDDVTLSAIADTGVPNIWYLSCDPATLARDLKILAAKGYRLGVVQPFDMFPQTGHIETLVTLYRESAVQEAVIAKAFKDAPVPQWPADEFNETNNANQEYPDFVIRKD
ncbi:MAG TPA: 23S rRNA (uracil(1939)-C(5))-methyltransferase RlmD [Candidatus Baltobacteraceae bacterium]|nr:23S rRNA (uracil(1939)-C(5))-methyltransferase RlmD [Candidatus Baltobacteraceae bacterium]